MVFMTPESPQDDVAINRLLDVCFGASRHNKTVYRLRSGVAPLPELCFVARAVPAGPLQGTIRYWPVRIEKTPALLLGPIAVAPEGQGHGVGAQLMTHSLETARRNGHRIVLLVGDAPYYGRFGFTRGLAEGLILPGPVDPARFLALELAPGALAGVQGRVLPERPAPAAVGAA